MRRAWGVAGVVAVLLMMAAPGLAQSPVVPGPPQLSASSAILVDLRTGRVVYEKDARTVRPVASLTKVATALVARERYALEETVTVTTVVNTVSGSKLGLKPGMQMSVRHLLAGLLVLSGNDAAAVLAAHDALGTDGFMRAANAKARSLGAAASTFVNPHGLDAPGHASTAWDMAILGRALLADPALAEIVASDRYAIPWPDGTERVIANHNRLVGSYPGTIGVKTGYTNDAGRCLIAAVRTDAGTALAVVLNSRDHYADTKALVEWYKTRPAPVLPAAWLQTPKPVPTLPTSARSSQEASGSARFRWIAFPMTLLAGAMLLTVRPRRRISPLAEAAQFHPYLEPLALSDERR